MSIGKFVSPLSLPSFLDAHQKDGVQWILSRRGSYLAHAPGAGKTCVAIIASMLTEGEGYTVFIVPPNLVENWMREIALWYSKMKGKDAPSVLACAINSDGLWFKDFEFDENAPDKFLVVPDSILINPKVIKQLAEIKKKFVAVDEASRMKESGSGRTCALFGGTVKYNGAEYTSPGLMRGTKHFVLMDGSPMPNRPMELWAPTFAVSPKSINYMSQVDFGYRYCGARHNERGQVVFTGASHQDELREKLQKDFMHVVTEKELNHPERLRSIVYTTEDVIKAKDRKWQQECAGLIKGMREISDDTPSGLGELARARRELGLAKVPWIAEYTKMQLAKGEKVLLFVWHQDVAIELLKRLMPVIKSSVKHFSLKPLITGNTDAGRRERIFKTFQEGELNLIIGNISAMGRGHNLQRATRCIFGEWSWTDETNVQAEKRASRKGNLERSVPCNYICVPGSLDDVVLKANFRKHKETKRIIG